MSKDERENLQNEWLLLFAKENHTLRVWQKDKTINVPEDEFDAYLVKMAKRLHQSHSEEESTS
ncbi:DUF3658 domain-containing protein [Bacillus sp. SL00103]